MTGKAHVRVIALGTIVLAFGCSDRTRTPRAPFTAAQPDLGWVDVDPSLVDRPVRSLCTSGARVCIGENDPQYRLCVDGLRFESGRCDDGEVCREGACLPFRCIPDRPLCVGAKVAAECAADGHSVTKSSTCGDGELCRGGACVNACQDARETRSYIGCDYVARRLPNIGLEGLDEPPFGIVVANPSHLIDAVVTVNSWRTGRPAELREPFELSKGTFDPVPLESHIIHSDGTTTALTTTDRVSVAPGAAAVFLPNRELVYSVQSNMPVVAYQFSPWCCNFTTTNDASLLLPTSALGSRYRIAGYPTFDRNVEYQSYFEVVALEDTQVVVQAPVPVRRGATRLTRHEFPLPANEIAVFIADDGDPSGTLITTDVPVGVFVGHECTFVPQNEWACDHLESMIPPANTLGKRYVLVPTRQRGRKEDAVTEGTYWRLAPDEPATIRFDPPLEELGVLPLSHQLSTACADKLNDAGELVLDEGEACELGLKQAVALSSTGALLVVGIVSGHQSTGVRSYGTQAGDPALFVAAPVEQFRRDYAFVSPPTYARNYVSIAAPAGAAISFDGSSVPESQRLERRGVDLDGERWEVFTIAVEAGLHEMSSDAKFGIIAYAYDDFVSYAFTGGLDLLPKGR